MGGWRRREWHVWPIRFCSWHRQSFFSAYLSLFHFWSALERNFPNGTGYPTIFNGTGWITTLRRWGMRIFSSHWRIHWKIRWLLRFLQMGSDYYLHCFWQVKSKRHPSSGACWSSRIFWAESCWDLSGILFLYRDFRHLENGWGWSSYRSRGWERRGRHSGPSWSSAYGRCQDM